MWVSGERDRRYFVWSLKAKLSEWKRRELDRELTSSVAACCIGRGMVLSAAVHPSGAI